MVDEIDIEDLIEEEQCVFTLTEAGYIKRTPVSEYTAQSKGGMGKKGITTREEDTVVDVFTASTHDYLLFFTDTGKVYRKKGYQIPESGKTARGTNIVNILPVEQGRGSRPCSTTGRGEGQLYLFMTTRNGTVKRLPVETLKNLRNNGIRALTLDEGDELINVQETDGSQRILIATHDGQAVCFDETDVRAMGRTAVGVRGIRLREGDYVVGAARARRARRCSPSRKRATASVRRWRNTASPAGAAWASGTTPSRKRPAPLWASRWWTDRRTCC